MKKHLTQLLLSLLFLVVTAMTCDEQDWAEPIDVPCTLKKWSYIIGIMQVRNLRRLLITKFSKKLI